jgi:hypothetical protein
MPWRYGRGMLRNPRRLGASSAESAEHELLEASMKRNICLAVTLSMA